MKISGKKTGIIAGIIFGFVLFAVGWFIYRALPIGSGYTAKYICSSTFISNRNPKTVFKQDVMPVNPLFSLLTFTVNREKQYVTSSAWGLLTAKAIYREGCGCTLVVGTTEEKLRDQKIVNPQNSGIHPKINPNLPWPAGNAAPSSTLPAGIDSRQLKLAIDNAFSEPTPDISRKTRALVVIYRGQLIAERYAPGFHRDMPLLGWSISKSITNALVGILVMKGKLKIEEPAPISLWQKSGDRRKKITLDQLLRMSSGLAFEEQYAPLKDATEMLYNSYDYAEFAAHMPLEAEPDTIWNYSSGTANIVARIVRRVAETEYPHYYTFIHRELFDRLGMHSAVMEPDSSGTFVGSSYSFATPRDWARFGQLYLQDGIWEGKRILPAGWITYTTRPTPPAPKGEYGAFFWLNAGLPSAPEKRYWPNSPQDAYAAQGFQEQKIIIIPSEKLVLVRFGATSKKEAWDTDTFIVDVIKALP